MTTMTTVPTNRDGWIRNGRELIRVRTSGAETAGALFALDVRMPPGGGPPALHRHEASEVYMVDSGELTIYAEGDDGEIARSTAGPGELVAIAGGREHTIRNEGDETAAARVVFAPAARMEEFALSAAALPAGAGPQEVTRLAAEHGIEVTRPLEPVREALRSTAELIAPLADRWAMLLRTRKRDGGWVGTPVNVAVDGDRAYFGTPASTGKVKRLRNFAEVELAPSTLRGTPVGPFVAACARRLDGDEHDAAERRLRAKYPIVHRFAVPLELRIRRERGLTYELSGFRPL